MRHTNALICKLIAYLVIFGVIMPILGNLALPKSMILAAVHTLLLWIADLVILPRIGRSAATGVDFALLFVGSFLVLGAISAIPRLFSILVAAGLATLFEWWFHPYLIRERVVE